MRLSICGAVLVAVLVLGGGPSVSAAQETGTPIFKAPYRAFDQHEFGASLSDPGGYSFALEGFYRYGRGQHDLSLRAGFADTGADVTAYLIGANFRTQILSYSDAVPVDGALTLGLGAIFFEGDDRFLIPVGISLGRRFNVEGSSTTFVPYVHPVIVPSFFGGDSGVDFALGLGVDLRVSDNLALRASGGLGDIEGVGISLAYLR